jgi:hypothetical protein
MPANDIFGPIFAGICPPAKPTLDVALKVLENAIAAFPKEHELESAINLLWNGYKLMELGLNKLEERLYLEGYVGDELAGKERG